MPNKIERSAVATLPQRVDAHDSKVKSLSSKLFTKENAIFAAKVAGAIVLAGGAMALTGYALEAGGVSLMNNVAGGSFLGNVGSYMEVGGKGLFTVGKYTAYTILVPAYMVCYQGPRWLVTTGIPETTRLFRSYILEPGIEKIQWLANKTVEVVTYVHEHAIRPVIEKAQYVFAEYVVPAAIWAKDQIVFAATWAKDKIIVGLELARDYVLIPMVNLAKSALELAKQYIYEPILQAAQWAADKIIVALNHAKEYIVDPILNLASRVIEIAKDAVVWVATNFKDYVITPIVSGVEWAVTNFRDYIVTPVVNLIQKVAELASTYIVEPLSVAFRWAAEKIGNGLVFVRDHILPPLETAANAVWDFAKTYLFYPVGSALKWAGNRVVDLLNLGQEYVLTPMVNAAVALAQIVGEKVAQVATWVFATVIEPAYLTVSAAATSVATSAYNLGDKIYTTARNDIYSFLGYQS
ncbi:MAG: hypothetical protein JSS30_02325 [Verrucomicrobia bacterium]|nr:hypothetical protein [Verrucomicrobiota bacterium]